MNNRTVQEILKITGRYEEFLAGLTDEQFQQTPLSGGWSYSELYSHVFQANIASLIAMERCIHGNKTSSGSITWVGRLVLFFGRFPPVKLKAPEQIASLTTKATVEEACNYIIRFKQKLTEVTQDAHTTTSKNTIRHPRLGMLNASQWLRFIEIHTRHHYKQLKRISRLLISN